MTPLSSIDCELIRLLDEPDVCRLFQQYGSEMPDRMDRLRVAAIARDGSQVRRLAHQLKGSAGQYGFSKLAAHAAALEMLAQSAPTNAQLDRSIDEVIELCGEAQTLISEQFSKVQR